MLCYNSSRFTFHGYWRFPSHCIHSFIPRFALLYIGMLAPYPDRLRSSRSTSHGPQPPQRQHSLFHSRSALPFTRMRTSSHESSHSSDSPAAPNDDPVPPRPPRNPARLHVLPSRPSTSSSLPSLPDHKHSPLVPIVITSPFASPLPVRPYSLIIPLLILFLALCRFYPYPQKEFKVRTQRKRFFERLVSSHPRRSYQKRFIGS